MASKKEPQGLGNAKQLRMSEELEGRIRKFQEKFRKENGIAIDLSTAMRALIEYALTQKGL